MPYNRGRIPSPSGTSASSSRGAASGLSFSLSHQASWTFGSGSTDATDPLPLTVLRFQPPTDPNGIAPADTAFTIPFTVQQQGPAGIGASTRCCAR